MNSDLIRILLTAALLLPLFSSAVIIFSTRRVMFKSAAWFATGVMGVAFGCSLLALYYWMKASDPQTILWEIPWIPLMRGPGEAGASWLTLGVMIDSLTIAMMAMVCGISALVHVYSIGYMDGDKRYNWFFAYLSLFSFSMLGIVMANSLIMLFVFWELVGLTSYLLIGFWFEKRGPQLACKKAFVMNRIGDMGFLIGMGILFYQLGGQVLLPAAGGIAGPGGRESVSMFEAIRALVESQGHTITDPPLWLTMAGIGLFFGAIGKSAQFPLHTWLPDAMEGPTPVSSIVHSATMVAAGVYLTARIYPILTPGAHLFIATIGLITLVMAACMAMVMTDIKRVLAYSTLSQLGYMVLGLGAGAYGFALYHLIAHAFFKCCLFQCAGSVIHAAHHQQDMRYYGGLWRKLPSTAVCYGICTLAIAGASIPLTDYGISGYYSKDGIIAGTYNYGQALSGIGYELGPLFYWLPLIVAYMTVFYMARSFALTFLGKPRDQHLYDNIHKPPFTMVFSQLCLAAMAVVSVPYLIDFLPLIEHSRPGEVSETVDGVFQVVTRVQPAEFGHHPGETNYEAFHFVHSGLLQGFGWMLALCAGLIQYVPGMKYSEKVVRYPVIKQLYTWSYNKFYFDGLYDGFVVGLGKAVAYASRWIDTYLVDGLVNLVALITRGWAWATNVFDVGVVDGAVNGAANAAYSGGGVLRTTQVGRVRAYVLLMFGAVSLITLVVVTVVLVMG